MFFKMSPDLDNFNKPTPCSTNITRIFICADKATEEKRGNSVGIAIRNVLSGNFAYLPFYVIGRVINLRLMPFYRGNHVPSDVLNSSRCFFRNCLNIILLRKKMVYNVTKHGTIHEFEIGY
ncbi:Hypothetical predicted protein [Octopus vulgaris]|uniref:Uncharacterized protein n=1 Tax=Octopus vulgaris TaxID=6645 RepID=A0AA36AHD1_OCTVU|nr:Hypothetical predicted protein [Octopus vulgaris]